MRNPQNPILTSKTPAPYISVPGVSYESLFCGSSHGEIYVSLSPPPRFYLGEYSRKKGTLSIKELLDQEPSPHHNVYCS